MTQAAVAAAARTRFALPERLPTRLPAWLWSPRVLVFPLIAFTWWQLARHAIWADEAQAWNLALASRTPAALFRNLGYEGHPGAWHLLLWLAGHVSHAPWAMKAVHGAVAAAVMLLIAWRAPFGRAERILLLLSYFVLFEYAVVSRGYALGMLAALGYAALGSSGNPSMGDARHRIGRFACLGLAANADLFACLFSIAAAGTEVLRGGARTRAGRAGLVLYAALLLLAVATMWPAPDHRDGHYTAFIWAGTRPWFLQLLLMVALQGGGAFLPLYWHWLPFGDATSLTVPVLPLLAYLPFRALRGHADLRWLYGVTVAASVGFGFVFNIGNTWHAGIAFVAFLACTWQARVRGTPPRRAATALFAINAVAGVAATALSLLHPFSASAAAADWIRARGLAGAYWIGLPAISAAPVSAYLGQMPVHLLECGCAATFVRWDAHWQGVEDDAPARIAALMARDGRQDAWLLHDRVLPIDPQAAQAAGLHLEPAAGFDDALITTEHFEVVHVTRR